MCRSPGTRFLFLCHLVTAHVITAAISKHTVEPRAVVIIPCHCCCIKAHLQFGSDIGSDGKWQPLLILIPWPMWSEDTTCIKEYGHLLWEG